MSQIKGLAQAEQDLSDIQILKKTPAFERYFLRRLKEKRDTFAQQILEQDGTGEEREMWRQLYFEYKQLCGMLDQDEANAVKLLNQRG